MRSPVEAVHPDRNLLECARPDALGERGEEHFAHVTQLEGVEVAAFQREILDHGPVQRLALLPQDPQRGLEWFHINPFAPRA